MPTISPLTTEPSSIHAGDTLSWLITLADYPASAGWTLKYNALSPAHRIEITATASGDNHAVAVAGTTSDDYAPGTYSLTKYVQHSDGSRVTLAQLSLVVLPNLAGATAAADYRSHAQKVLDAIEAVLENRATTDQAEFTLGGTTLKRTSHTDLLKFRTSYQNEVALERQAAAETGSNSKLGTPVTFFANTNTGPRIFPWGRG